jgi:hypothetical protein
VPVPDSWLVDDDLAHVCTFDETAVAASRTAAAEAEGVALSQEQVLPAVLHGDTETVSYQYLARILKNWAFLGTSFDHVVAAVFLCRHGLRCSVCGGGSFLASPLNDADHDYFDVAKNGIVALSDSAHQFSMNCASPLHRRIQLMTYFVYCHVDPQAVHQPFH